MRYVISKGMKDAEEMAYRIYITDSIHAYGEGKTLVKRYIDIIHPPKEVDENGDDIAEKIITEMGLKLS